MGKVSHFREPQVWQRGMDVVEMVYRASADFPKPELYGLTSQLRRAAVSVPSNIAEGHSRTSTRDYLNHLSMAQGSLAEVQTQLEIAKRLGYITDQHINPILAEAAILGKQLHTPRDVLGRKL
jgi:four helix bundle protein